MAGDSDQMGANDAEALRKANEARAAAAAGLDPAALSQGDIEALLASQQAAHTGRAATSPAMGAGSSASPHNAVGDDIELLLSHAERALASARAPAAPELPPGVSSFKFEDFSGAPPSTEAATIELIRDVELDLKIELGRTHMYLEDVLKLRKGSVVPLDKLAGDPVDIYVNGRLIARGEVLVLNDNFCVRVAELVSGELSAAG
jgi:flagellar motor switch protein FliN/FliY